MSIHLRNLKKYFHDINPFSPIVLLISLLVVSVLFYRLALGYYEAKYTESAHVGVNRTGVSSFGYAVGNCVHCHEQKASIGGAEPAPTGGPDEFLLFAPNNPTSQTNNFCFQCHDSASSVQAVTNNDYGSEFGGGTANSTDIKDAFNFGPPNQTYKDGSSHNLEYVRNTTKNRSALGDWMTNKTNACVPCHDPHYAQRNWEVETTEHGGVKTAVRRANSPSSSVGRPRNLWGDEANCPEYDELMSEYVGAKTYQAPLHKGGGYEPNGLGEPAGGWGSNLPNYVQICRLCHNTTISNHDAVTGGRGLYKIVWSGKQHGKGARGSVPYPDHGELKAPYTEATNYCLSCTDCHEPHGSPNPWLLRTCVNGMDGIIIPDNSDPDNMYPNNFYNFCIACHVVYDTDHPLSPMNHTFTLSQAPHARCSDCHAHNCVSW